MTDELARAFLRHWAELHGVEQVSRITGGELKDVFRVDAGGGSFALRIYTIDVSAEDIASELELTAPFAERLPEVPTAIPTSAGEPLATEGGRTAVLTTFIEGERPDAQHPDHRRAAAETLARLHGGAAKLDRPRPRDGYPPYRDLDWRHNRWWSWPDVERYLQAAPPEQATRVRERLSAELATLDGELKALVELDLPSMPIHNDFFPSNLLERDGRIVGITDWDECTVDWRALELANAACEFARTSDEPEIDPALARAFIDDYLRAGGVLLDREVESLRRVRRVRLLWETLYELSRATRASTPDWQYLWDNLRSLDEIPRLY